MRVFHAPKVILVARPVLSKEGVASLLMEYGVSPVLGWDRGDDPRLLSDGDGLAELMGRMCYGSFGERQGRIGSMAYFENVLKGGHGSVAEHACFSFVVARASRSFTHQMVRHRAGVSPSQESQHFIKYVEDDEDTKGAQEAGLVLTGVPEELHAHWLQSATLALKDYDVAWKRLKALGMKKKEACERARGLLPNCLESRLGVTMNCRAIRHFCELRGKEDNALEIRLVACQVANIMRTEAPALLQDVEVYAAADGHPAVRSEWRKV